VKPAGLLPRTRKGIASLAAISVLVTGPVVVAVLHEGFPITDVDLSVSNVWVTNGQRILAGRLNRQIDELDAAVAATTSSVDVVQNGSTVLLYDPSLGSIQQVDPAYTTLDVQVEVDPGSEVSLGGTTLAVLSPSSGKLWLSDTANGLSLDIASQAPVLTLGPGAHVAVSTTGRVFATAPEEQTLYTIAEIGASPSAAAMPKFDRHELTAVGDTPVILDFASNTLILPGGQTPKLPAPGMHVQQPGAVNSFVLVASGSGLMQVPLGGGDVTTIDADVSTNLTDPNDVTPPVWLDGCSHGAWAGAQRYTYACANDDVKNIDIQKPTAGSILVFRVNRSTIALNNLTSGDVWLAAASLVAVENWDQVTPPKQEESTDGDQKSSQQSVEETLAERTPENRPPVAKDDSFGVRPKTSTVLPLLANDTDPDGDVLVVSDTGTLSDTWGTIDYIDGGRALQVTPSETAAGSISFSYTVSDGRAGGVAQARVTLSVRSPEQNLAPVARRSAAITVEQGQTVEYNVLADWFDPDGDDVYLKSASSSSGDIVRFTPDGLITFQQRSGGLGEKEVQFTVSDGTLFGAGLLTVDVKAGGSLNPIGTADFAQTYVGEPVLIEPLVNDISPSNERLVLLGIEEEPSDASVTPSLERGRITFSAQQAGSYYVIYSLGAGPKSSVGIIRVDVREDPNSVLPPVAVKDIAYLRAGEPTSISVLTNDVSPGGRVLAVQSTDTSNTNGQLSVELLGNQVIRVTASDAMTRQAQFSYTISDGLASATTSVTVIPVPRLVKHQPPIAKDDSVNVRASDIVTVDVLKNDTHPDSVLMTVDPELLDTSNAGGLAFVANGKVRYQAPAEAGVYDVAYRISDKYGESASARVQFTVVADDEQNNSAPLPLPLTARVVAGAQVKVDIPLDGIDPDGDSVVLVGISSNPTLGRIAAQSSTSITYESIEGSTGTDTFHYKVQDTYGLIAVGVIRIGVIPAPESTVPPNAVDDKVLLKPSRTGTVDVLANDSDPAGKAISIDKILEVDPALDVKIIKNQIAVTTPKTEGTYTIRYQITNGHGGVDSAFVQVGVSATAVAEYPVAIDQVIEPKDAVGKTTVNVDPLTGAKNPSGLVSDLVISLEGANASAGSLTPDGTIDVTPGPWRKAIAYRLTNAIDKLSATAFIIVPPAASQEDTFSAPYLDPDLPEQIVDMNGGKSWKLDDILIVPSGGKAIITTQTSVAAIKSDGTAPYVDDTTIQFKPARDYRGPASITFEVTDGESADDKTGRVAIITLPITVGDPDFRDVAPTFTTQNVTLEGGSESELTIDLRDSSDHPNPDILSRLTYEKFSGATDAIHANLSGSTVTISAALNVPFGTKATLHFMVHYDRFDVPGVVNISVVHSSRPLAQPGDDHVVALRGGSGSSSVLDNDWNPFSSQGKPLQVISATIDNTSSGATVSLDEATDTVTVSTDSSFIGDVSVIYVVRDGTEDPTRDVQGNFVVTVEDRPDKPAKPTIVTEGDQDASINFAAPASNGNPIDQYRISWGSQTKIVTYAGTHTISGLTNGTDYSFRVAAHNAHGWGEDSVGSDNARPYGAPSAPSSVSVSASSNGSGNVTVNWGAAASNGRNVTNYEVTLSDGTVYLAGAVTSYTFSGKSIGTAYNASVRAKNARSFGASTSSTASGTPRPGVPTNVNSSGATTSQVTFNWSAPSQGGVDQYRYRTGGSWTTTNGTSYTQTGSAGQTYTIEVQASKNGVWSDSATASGTIVSPPPRTVTLSRGAFKSGTSNAYQYHVELRNFPAGTNVLLQCWDHGAPMVDPATGNTVSSYTRTTYATGSWNGDLPCYSGYGSYSVYERNFGVSSNFIAAW
jgi:large repetitive protein